MDERETPDGKTVHVATDEGAIGSEGPFYVAYRDPDRERRYGWFCSNCESFDNAMGPMGRVHCNRCGNRRKPTEWDAAHE
jgi:hypothetical protein